MSVMTMAAVGDALGAPYEFNEHRYQRGGMLTHQRHSGGEAGEWTDDTAQAYCILEAARRTSLNPRFFPDEVARLFVQWFQEDGNGVGLQTSAVLAEHDAATVTAGDLILASQRYHKAHPDKSAGNGGLMRVHAVACLPLPREAAAMTARLVTMLTHADPLCQEASVLWVEMLRLAQEAGELRPTVGLPLLPQERHYYWEQVLAEAEEEPSAVFGKRGWWVVPTLQQALSAVLHHREHLWARPEAVFEELIACEEADSDTVAAVAGGLLGALAVDTTALPPALTAPVHGRWPTPLTLASLEELETVVRRQPPASGFQKPDEM